MSITGILWVELKGNEIFLPLTLTGTWIGTENEKNTFCMSLSLVHIKILILISFVFMYI